MISVRTLRSDEFRAAHSVFRAGLHQAPADDAGWTVVEPSYLPDRAHGAFDDELDDGLIGSAQSFAMTMTVPGGARLPMAGVSRVAVRADRTRRGALTSLMRAQLTGVAELGDAFATLRASEGRIYGRFGYGIATHGCTVEIDLWRARPHPALPTGGDVRIITAAQARSWLPGVYDRIGLDRPGAAARPAGWWAINAPDSPVRRDRHAVVAVHAPGPDAGGDDIDGFVLYSATSEGEERVLEVDDLVAATPRAHAALWGHVMRADLVRRVRAQLRPVDEPVELLVDDVRAVRRTSIDDEVWLRLVDVERALGARSYGAAEPVVLRVHDAALPANDGAYRVGPDGAQRLASVPETVDLELDVAELATLYLGDRRPSVLAGVGRITATDPAALLRADALFASPVVPWCGTYF